jgi:outer membrane lipoprotein SlyB
MQKLFLITALALVLGLSGCDKDDDGPSGLSKTEAQAEIT